MLGPDGDNVRCRYAYCIGVPPQRNSSIKLNAYVPGQFRNLPERVWPLAPRRDRRTLVDN